MFLELDEYLSLARKMLSRRSLDLVKDDDAIGYVARYAMRADEIFDGRGSRDAFRVKYADYGARVCLRNLVRNKKKQIWSLDAVSKFDNHSSLGDSIGSSKDDPAIKLANNELVDQILSSSVLTDTQRMYIYNHYIESMSINEIADANNVSRQAVHFSISAGLNKLRSAFTNE